MPMLKTCLKICQDLRPMAGHLAPPPSCSSPIPALLPVVQLSKPTTWYCFQTRKKPHNTCLQIRDFCSVVFFKVLSSYGKLRKACLPMNGNWRYRWWVHVTYSGDEDACLPSFICLIVILVTHLISSPTFAVVGCGVSQLQLLCASQRWTMSVWCAEKELHLVVFSSFIIYSSWLPRPSPSLWRDSCLMNASPIQGLLSLTALQIWTLIVSCNLEVLSCS